jgi:hypothetical protein
LHEGNGGGGGADQDQGDEGGDAEQGLALRGQPLLRADEVGGELRRQAEGVLGPVGGGVRLRADADRGVDLGLEFGGAFGGAGAKEPDAADVDAELLADEENRAAEIDPDVGGALVAVGVERSGEEQVPVFPAATATSSLARGRRVSCPWSTAVGGRTLTRWSPARSTLRTIWSSNVRGSRWSRWLCGFWEPAVVWKLQEAGPSNTFARSACRAIIDWSAAPLAGAVSISWWARRGWARSRETVDPR